MEINKLTKQNKSDDHPVGTPTRPGGTPGNNGISTKYDDIERSKNIKSEKQMNIENQVL